MRLSWANPAGLAPISETPDLVALPEARGRLRADRDLLLKQSPACLAISWQSGSGWLPACWATSVSHCTILSRICSLKNERFGVFWRINVVATSMWDEISLAVLSEAAAGRTHWSLDPLWETVDAGQRLNPGGVAAGRRIPASLLLHRYGQLEWRSQPYPSSTQNENGRTLLYADTMHGFLNFCGILSAGRHAVELIAVYLRSELT
jgi:hypothetical protein